MANGGWRSAKVKRPRAELEPAVAVLCGELEQANPGLEYHLLGSWRRGAPVVGDLDVLLINEPGTLSPDLLSSGVVLPQSVTYQRHGDRIANGDLRINHEGDLVHVDFWACKPASRGAMMCFATGPAELNVYQRMRAKARGMALSQNALALRSTGEQLDDGTEESIYRILEMSWLSPEDRQRWAR